MCFAQVVALAWIALTVTLLLRNFSRYRAWYQVRTGRDIPALTPKALTLPFNERHGNLRLETLRKRAVSSFAQWIVAMIGGFALILALVSAYPCS